MRNKVIAKGWVIPIYDFKLKLVVFDEVDDLKQFSFYNQIDSHFKTMKFQGLTMESNEKCEALIIVKRGHQHTLAHELIHVIRYVGRIKKIDFDEESEAYLMEYMFKICNQYVTGKLNHR